MPRPRKEGADYFPMDTGIFQDRKVILLKNATGFAGVGVLMALYAEIYADGYYMKWSADDAAIVAEKIGGGCKVEYVEEVVRICLEKGLFDDGMFLRHGILTSKGIQRRYIRICENRGTIRVAEKYSLIDINSPYDVPPHIAEKIMPFFVNSRETPGFTADNPQSKAEEIIKHNIKQIEEDCAGYAVSAPEKENRETAANCETAAAACDTHDCATHDCATHDCATHDCATHDCATHDCATHDCATHDCATHDCATHDCATRDSDTLRDNAPYSVETLFPASVARAVRRALGRGLAKWTRVFPKGVVSRAIDEALAYNALNIKYINSILENWRKVGVVDLESAERYLAEWEKEKEKEDKTDVKSPKKERPGGKWGYYGRKWDFAELERLASQKNRETLGT